MISLMTIFRHRGQGLAAPLPPHRAHGFDVKSRDSWLRVSVEPSLAEAAIIRRECERLEGCLLCEGVPADLDVPLLRMLLGPRDVMRQLQPVVQRIVSATLRHSPDRAKLWNLCTPRPACHLQALLLGASLSEDCVQGDIGPHQSTLHALLVEMMTSCAMNPDPVDMHLAFKLAVRVWDTCRFYDVASIPIGLVSPEAVEGWGRFIATALQRQGAGVGWSAETKWALRLLERWYEFSELSELEHNLAAEGAMAPAGPGGGGLLPDQYVEAEDRAVILDHCARVGALRVLRFATSGNEPSASWTALIEMAMRHLGVSAEEEVNWEENAAAVCAHQNSPSEAFLCVEGWARRDPFNRAVAACWAKVEGAKDVDITLSQLCTERLSDVVALEVCRATYALPHVLTPGRIQAIQLLTRNDNKFVRHRAWLLLARLRPPAPCEFVKDAWVPVNYAAVCAGAAPLEVALEVAERCHDFDLVATPIVSLCSPENAHRVLVTMCDSFLSAPSDKMLRAIAELSSQSKAALLPKVLDVVFASQQRFLAMAESAILLASRVSCSRALPFLFHYYMGGLSSQWSYTSGLFLGAEVPCDTYVAAFCRAMATNAEGSHLLSMGQMTLIVARKLLGMAPSIVIDPRLNPMIDESREEMPHWGGCLLLETLGAINAKDLPLHPHLARELLDVFRGSPFYWPAFRAAVACGVTDESLWRRALQSSPQSSRQRVTVFLHAVRLVVQRWPGTATEDPEGAEWTQLVVQTLRLICRRKRERAADNDYDDWVHRMQLPHAWQRVRPDELGFPLEKYLTPREVQGLAI